MQTKTTVLSALCPDDDQASQCLGDDGIHGLFVDVDENGIAYSWVSRPGDDSFITDEEIQHVQDFFAGKYCTSAAGPRCVAGCFEEMAGNWSK